MQDPTGAKSRIVQNRGLVGAYGPHISRARHQMEEEEDGGVSIPGATQKRRDRSSKQALAPLRYGCSQII